jgi:site-specific DNA recombinase
LYARVSTDKQEREETIASQVDWLQQTAQARGYEVLPGNLFIDDGVSGTRLDRPALERLRDLAAEGAFEVVLVTAPDRLACRYAYQVVLVDELTRVGSRCVPRVAPHVRWCRAVAPAGVGVEVWYHT